MGHPGLMLASKGAPPARILIMGTDSDFYDEWFCKTHLRPWNRGCARRWHSV